VRSLSSARQAIFDTLIVFPNLLVPNACVSVQFLVMNSFSSRSDLEIWCAFKAGDDQAFEYIYHRHSPELFSYGCHIVKDRQLVEDCMHDLFVYLFQHRTTIGDTNAIKYYLFKSLRRRIAEALKKQNKAFTQSDELLREDVVEIFSASPEVKIIDDESNAYQSRRLVTAVDALPKRQREAIYLLYFSGLGYPEIAEIMSLNVRTVYNQVHTAVQTLRKQLKRSGILPLPQFLE
jgi:RNA polymerase sigma factor (sigma-70 family)